MAQKRMFSKEITRSARFLMMPQSSRLLYYDLGMEADDEGIVEAFTVLRTTGAAEDDLRILVAKGFVLILNEDLVTYITDWRRNNTIQSDRRHESIYHDLLVKVLSDTSCIQAVSILDTEESPDKYRGDLAKERVSPGAPTLEQVEAFCKERNSPVDPQRFYHKNAAHGWRDAVGRPITNWQSLLISWEPLETKYSADKESKRSRYDLNPGADAENDPRWANVHYDIGPQHFEE